MLPSGVFSTKYDAELAILRTRAQWILLAVSLALLLAIPAFASTYWLNWLVRLATTLIAVMGLHILTGLCGQFSLGHAAFVGVGAYVTAILTVKFGISSWACLPLSMLGGGLAGLVFGLPCFRLKGFYLAISTVAASYVLVWCMIHFDQWTGGWGGISLAPLTIGNINFSSGSACYYLAVGLVVLAAFVAKNLQRTATGRAFVAIRDNDLAAEVSGISLFRYKLLAFFIGCLFAGLAGWLWANTQLRVNPEQFRLQDSIWYEGMVIIGGMGSTAGVFFGVMLFKCLEAVIDSITPYVPAMQFHVAMSMMLYSAIIIAFVIWQPKGLSHLWERIKTHYRLHPYSY